MTNELLKKGQNLLNEIKSLEDHKESIRKYYPNDELIRVSFSRVGFTSSEKLFPGLVPTKFYETYMEALNEKVLLLKEEFDSL